MKVGDGEEDLADDAREVLLRDQPVLGVCVLHPESQVLPQPVAVVHDVDPLQPQPCQIRAGAKAAR